MSIYTDAQEIIHSALEACLPDQAVRRALEGKELGSGRVFLVALGKAAWQMARCAAELLGPRLEQGVVVTKHGHSQGDIPRCQVFEGGHPVPDEGSFRGTRAAMELVQDLAPQDTVVLLVSGGGSALFERPLIPAEELAQLTSALLACGADIVEMNTVRKRLSAVKGGRFAQLCAPAQVYSIVLSDILGDPLDMIASGLSGPLHLRPGPGHRGEVPAPPVRPGPRPSGPGDPQGAGQCRDRHHWKRAGALLRRRRRLPAAGL